MHVALPPCLNLMNRGIVQISSSHKPFLNLYELAIFKFKVRKT